MSDTLVEAVSKAKEPKFEPSSETRDGFLVTRRRKDYVEIEHNGKTVGQIRGDITEQDIDLQLQRAKLNRQKQDLL